MNQSQHVIPFTDEDVRRARTFAEDACRIITTGAKWGEKRP